jgi:hypothetical protein
MPVRARTPTIASSSASDATIKQEPGSVIIKQEPGSITIKQEPTDDDWQPGVHHDSSALSIQPMLSNLSVMYDADIRVRQTIEHDKNASCCDLPLMFGEPVLTTYKRGEQEYSNFQGCPTAFASNLDENGDEITLKKRQARFYHTENPACRRIAVEEEEDDMWLCRRDQPDDGHVPSGRLPCYSCEDNTTVAGRRETTQLKIGTDGPTFVFCEEVCFRTFYDQVATSVIDTKWCTGEGRTEIRRVNAPVYFRKVNQDSLHKVRDFTGQGKEESLQNLEHMGEQGAPWA